MVARMSLKNLLLHKICFCKCTRPFLRSNLIFKKQINTRLNFGVKHPKPELATAFDNENYVLLFNSLYVIELQENYPTSSIQCVNIGDCINGDVAAIKCGVDTRDTFGLIIINKLVTLKSTGQITSFSSYRKGLDGSKTECWKDLGKLTQWFNFRQLTINFDKKKQVYHVYMLCRFTTIV